LLEDQGGSCKICNNKDGDRKLAVDHCHHSGQVRGLLCRRCNVAIGSLEDDPVLLQKAIDYLVSAKEDLMVSTKDVDVVEDSVATKEEIQIRVQHLRNIDNN